MRSKPARWAVSSPRSTSLQCGNGSIATPHPSELFGDDWQDWGMDAPASEGDTTAPPA
ncbi:DUF3079 domain-containing protein [Roseateles sp. BYS96W]